MSFVQAGFLFATTAVAIPVLVHLMSRWQVRRLELGTMRFLQEVIHDGAHRRKIRRWLLLLTRMALVALLALLFARPFLAERSRRDGDVLRVVLIDRSASMGMPGKSGRLIDDAVAAAARSVAGLGEDAKVMWAWFDRAVTPLPESIRRPSPPRAVVGDTNYLEALSWARDRIDGFPNSRADVVLVTDLQQSGLASDAPATESLGFPADVPVRIIDVGRPAANNLAITSVFPPTTRLETRQDVVIPVTLFNYGTLPFEEVPLTASAFNGSRTVRLKKSINVPGGQAEEILFDFGLLDAGRWEVTIAMDASDDLAADNRRFTALEVAAPIEVTVLDSGSSDDGVTSESYFLVTALRQSEVREERLDDVDDTSGDRGRFHVDVVYLQDQSPHPFDVETTPLVVVADAGAVAGGTIGQLDQYVRRGGKLLVFAGEGDAGNDPGPMWQQSGLSPGSLGGPVRSGAMPFRITSLGKPGAMLRPFQDPQHGDLSRLSFHTLLPVEVDDATDVLAWFDPSRPAVTQHELGKGRVVWFLASADASWSDWTTSPLYLPLVQQMAADLLNLTGEGPIRFRSVGDDELPHRRFAADVSKVTLEADSSAVSKPSRLVFERPGFDRRPDALYVVNGTAKESDPTRIETDALAQHFGLTAATSGLDMASSSVSGESRNELWHWLAAAAVVLLVTEFSLANRTAA